MWLAAVDVTTGTSGPYSVAAVLIVTLGGLGSLYFQGRRGRERPEQIAPAAAAPVAAETGRQVRDDLWEMFVVPLENQLDTERRLRAAAERAQAESERGLAACQAQREELQRQLTQALQELSQERRRDD